MELEKKTAVVIFPKTADQGLQGPVREKRGGCFSPLGKDGRYLKWQPQRSISYSGVFCLQMMILRLVM